MKTFYKNTDTSNKISMKIMEALKPFLIKSWMDVLCWELHQFVVTVVVYCMIGLYAVATVFCSSGCVHVIAFPSRWRDFVFVL